MPANHGHRERAEELLAGIAADAHTDPEVTAMAAVAEAVLAVADELKELGVLLGARQPGPPGLPGPIPGDIPPRPFPWPPG